MDPIWSFQLLGRYRVSSGERTISRFRTMKAAGLLAYLSYYRHRSHSRDGLMELFWPDAEPESARHSLSMALSSLRAVLEPPGIPTGAVLVADRSSVELNPEAFTTDVMRFEHALRLAAQAPDEALKVRHLSGAMELYGGPLLPGFYEEWVLAEQTRLGERFLQAVRQCLSLLRKRQETTRALSLASRAVTIHPLSEELALEVIQLLAAEGQVEAALRHYRELERRLEEELGERPAPSLQRLARHLEDVRLQQPLETPSVAAPASSPRLSSPEPPLPAGTVTFLLTEIGDSTLNWEEGEEAFRAALAIHDSLLRHQLRRHGGRQIEEDGGSFLIAFASAGDALACAVAAQRALAAQEWPANAPALRVRMILHAGDVELVEEEYRGPTLRRAARLLEVAQGGQTLCSEAACALLRRDLDAEIRLRDLGQFRLRDEEAPKRIFQVEYAGAAFTAFPPLRAERAHRSHLPLQMTRFFGRETELCELELLLAPGTTGSRLITLTGPGGTGKTRLATEAASRLVEKYAGAVWFVPLAAITDPRLLPRIILEALGQPPSEETSSLDQISALLTRQPSLLLLDNFEQLIGPPAPADRAASQEQDAVTLVQGLCERTPGLTVLVTSRQLLSLPGEREFPVPPLPTPDDAEAVTALSMFESVRLFIDRAQAARPDFRVTNSNAPAIAQLCIRLEGIPLAIELAASRAQVLSPAQMLQQLDDGPGGRFDLLVTRKRGIIERQRALRSTVEWSYRLLTPPLQQFYRRLAVFRGGWDVDAAEAVCEEPLALDQLSQLRESSLIQTEDGPDGIRFRMLDTLREYAQERLAESRELAAAVRSHCGYYLALAERAEPELRGPRQAGWLARLEADQQNFRAVLSTFLEEAQKAVAIEQQTDTAGSPAEELLRLVGALWYFWSIRGHLAEGRRQLAEVLALVPASHPTLGKSPLRAQALTGAGALAHDQSDYSSARELLEESVRLWREHAGRGDENGDRDRRFAQSLNCLANVFLDEEQPEAALPLYREALSLSRRAGDIRGAAMALSNLGVLHLDRGESDLAADLLTESIALKRDLGNPYGLAISLESLGNLERSRNNPVLARALCEEALAIRRDLGHRLGIAMSLNNLGHLLLEAGEITGAGSHLRESLDLFLELDEPRGAVESLTGLASSAAAEGCYEDAARLLAAMEAERERRGFEPRPCEKRVIQRCHTELREALDVPRLQRLEEEGRLIAFEQAVLVGRRIHSYLLSQGDGKLVEGLPLEVGRASVGR